MISARFALLVANGSCVTVSLRPFQVKPAQPDHSTRNGEARTVLGKLAGLWRPIKNTLIERMTVSYRIQSTCAIAHVQP